MGKFKELISCLRTRRLLEEDNFGFYCLKKDNKIEWDKLVEKFFWVSVNEMDKFQEENKISKEVILLGQEKFIELVIKEIKTDPRINQRVNNFLRSIRRKDYTLSNIKPKEILILLIIGLWQLLLKAQIISGFMEYSEELKDYLMNNTIPEARIEGISIELKVEEKYIEKIYQESFKDIKDTFQEIYRFSLEELIGKIIDIVEITYSEVMIHPFQLQVRSGLPPKAFDLIGGILREKRIVVPLS